MNFYEMGREFDKLNRSLDDETIQTYRREWLNQGWEKISEMFAVPALKRVDTWDSVADQAEYVLPYDYSGVDVALGFRNSTSVGYRRLDPVGEEQLKLIYERRTGNKGDVRFYDWTGSAGSHVALRSCQITNESATVICAGILTTDLGYWVRFESNSEDVTINPGDFGYKITAVTEGVSFTIDREYRGPSGTCNVRIRPAESAQVTVYGSPSSAIDEAFELTYYAKPRRLYNHSDVPEWPQMGLAIVFMAFSVAMDQMNDHTSAAVWFGRSSTKVGNLKKRRDSTATLVTDLTVGSVSGRKQGPSSLVPRIFRRR